MKPTTTGPSTLEERLMALYGDLEPADQDALFVMCAHADNANDTVPDVEGFSGSHTRIARPPMLRIHFGGDFLRLQNAAEKSNQVSGNLVTAMQKNASMIDDLTRQMR